MKLVSMNVVKRFFSRQVQIEVLREIRRRFDFDLSQLRHDRLLRR